MGSRWRRVVRSIRGLDWIGFKQIGSGYLPTLPWRWGALIWLAKGENDDDDTCCYFYESRSR